MTVRSHNLSCLFFHSASEEREIYLQIGSIHVLLLRTSTTRSQGEGVLSLAVHSRGGTRSVDITVIDFIFIRTNSDPVRAFCN